MPPSPLLEPSVMARVDRLTDRWRARAAHTEKARTPSTETVRELFDSGLLHLAIPKLYGGSGHGWPTLTEAARRAARVCPSTGWLIGVVGGHGAVAARLPSSAAKVLFDTGPNQLFATASVTSNGRITREDDGYRITGEWRFCSAVDHASWIMINGVRQDSPESGHHLFPVPADQACVLDTWHVTGMSGTGSKSVLLDDVFVSDDLVGGVEECFEGRTEGSRGPRDYLVEVPFTDYVNSTIVGPILGCAEGAFDAYLEWAESGGRAERARVQLTLAESSAELECARHLHDSLGVLLHTAGIDRRPLNQREVAGLRRDRAYLTRLCAHAVRRLVESLGTAAHVEGGVLSRHWRDLQMMAAHRDVNWDDNHAVFAMASTDRMPV